MLAKTFKLLLNIVIYLDSQHIRRSEDELFIKQSDLQLKPTF